MWREKAKKLYFLEKKTITDIAKELGKSRKTISLFLNSTKNIQEEKQKRKELSQKKKKEAKAAKRRNRSRTGEIHPGILKREHEIAVQILSREKYY